MRIRVQAQGSRLQVRGVARHARRERLSVSKRNYSSNMRSSDALFRLDLRLPTGIWIEHHVRYSFHFHLHLLGLIEFFGLGRRYSRRMAFGFKIWACLQVSSFDFQASGQPLKTRTRAKTIMDCIVIDNPTAPQVASSQARGRFFQAQFV
ncbi:hypothetical protein GALMADRAFT_806974 [Galerina marginata CBS 339.88]|uniref:Uncharacterized protein n=1 Tax=Galerina marginata (strain CBS 339.88) TaxID=685588 RepID=A0A067SJN9_GALM3|nr:hypothetical protein GALMADRAFT_806974 [Galerina marginata CBS 339.88]